MIRRSVIVGALLAGLLTTASVATPASASGSHGQGRCHPHVTLLSGSLSSGSGSTIGPDGALYVTEPGAGRIARVDRATGTTSTFASGLPERIPAVGLGGVMDVAFLGRTAYALVTLVSPDVGGTGIDGIYRIDDATHSTVVADIGAWATAHPPTTDFFVPTGLQYAMQPYRGGFLVSDGHHNRVLRARTDGVVSQVRAFGNIVPTGLDRRGRTVLMAEAGPLPHAPADGRVVAFDLSGGGVRTVASGAPLLVDVELVGHTLFALSQGTFGGGDPGAPALPGTGSLVRAHGRSLVPVVTGLDRPTSLEVVGHTAFVVTMTGGVWRISGIGSCGPKHRSDRFG